MFHLAAYSASLAAGPNLDMAAPNDKVLGTRNNHLILTEAFKVIAAYGNGALINRLRFNNAQLTQFFIPHIHPLDVAAVPSDIPNVMDLRNMPMDLPVNEEIILEAGNSGAGPTITNAFLWLAPPNFVQQLPAGGPTQTIRATAVIAAGAASTWGTEVNLVFERDPRNGVYAVIGAEMVSATAIAFRIRFPDMISPRGKQYRPGGLSSASFANEPWLPQRGANGGLGEWGRFHTFTVPQLECFGDATGGTYEVRLQLRYLGQDRDLVTRGPA